MIKIENQINWKKSSNILSVIIKFNGLHLLFGIQKFQIVFFIKSTYVLLRTRNPPKTLIKCQE